MKMLMHDKETLQLFSKRATMLKPVPAFGALFTIPANNAPRTTTRGHGKSCMGQESTTSQESLGYNAPTSRHTGRVEQLEIRCAGREQVPRCRFRIVCFVVVFD